MSTFPDTIKQPTPGTIFVHRLDSKDLPVLVYVEDKYQALLPRTGDGWLVSQRFSDYVYQSFDTYHDPDQIRADAKALIALLKELLLIPAVASTPELEALL